LFQEECSEETGRVLATSTDIHSLPSIYVYYFTDGSYSSIKAIFMNTEKIK
jgi:hypothetical protein